MTRRFAWIALALTLVGCGFVYMLGGSFTWLGLWMAQLGSREQNTEVAVDSGKAIYLARCAVCHGEKGEGRAGMYPAIVGSEWVDGPPERLAAIILDGIQGRVGNYQAVMPGWGAYLRDAEIAAVMTWLRERDGKGAVTAVEVNHARVETAARNTFWTEGDLRNLK